MKRKFFIQIFSVALLFISSLSLFGQNSVRPLAKKLYEIKQHARSTGKFDKLFNESTQNSRSKAISEVVSNAQLRRVDVEFESAELRHRHVGIFRHRSRKIRCFGSAHKTAQPNVQKCQI